MKNCLIILLFVLNACTSRIFLNPEYDNKKIKNKSLAIINIDSYQSVLSPQIIDSLTSKKSNLLLSPPLKAAIKRQSYFNKVNYMSIKSVENFRIYNLELPDKEIKAYLPQIGDKVRLDSINYDFVLFAYVPYDSLNKNQKSHSWLYNLFFEHSMNYTNNSYFDKDVYPDTIYAVQKKPSYKKNKNIGFERSVLTKRTIKIKTVAGEKELNIPEAQFPDFEFPDKYEINNFQFVLWDNNKGQIVNYGSFEKIWDTSYKKVVLETGRLILIKSPFYKRSKP